MTSEKELRQIAVSQLRESRGDLADDIALAIPDGFDGLEDHDLEQVAEMVSTWPIPDLPPADRDGCWWPKRGINYGHVRAADGGIKIARGGPYVATRYTSLHLTPDEAEELASLLLAAAHHERNQE